MKITSLHIFCILVLILIVGLATLHIIGASNTKTSDIFIIINGELIVPNIAPISIEDEFLLSAKCVFEKLDLDVNWNGNKVTFIKDGAILEVEAESSIIVIDGKEHKTDYSSKIIGNYFMVPARTIASSFGIQVSFNSDTNSLVFDSPSPLIMSYEKAIEIFDIGVTAKVTDVETGVVYMVKRIGGDTFADVETLTAEDTEKLKFTYDGEWSWRRRAIIINIDDIEIAASMAAMPHSGREDAPFGAIVDNRSGGAGRGINLNSIRDNNMNGVVDIYFYNSLIPGLNRVCERHQQMVLRAADYRK